MRYLLTLLVVLWTGAARAEVLRLAVTTSFVNSGLSDVLEPAFEAETGIDLQLLVVGTGQALALGAAGDVDGVLVHDRAAEEAFVAAGHAPYRREVMFNDFVLVGPAADPAEIAGAPTAAVALSRVARARAPFVSRGDDSGTHKAELRLWDMPPAGDWYLEVGQGMGAALNTAAGLDAYTLADRGSWLAFGNRRGLALLFEGDPALVNQYAFLPVATDRQPHVNAAAARAFEDWITGDTGQALIDGLRVAGERLFTANAR